MHRGAVDGGAVGGELEVLGAEGTDFAVEAGAADGGDVGVGYGFVDGGVEGVESEEGFEVGVCVGGGADVFEGEGDGEMA